VGVDVGVPDVDVALRGESLAYLGQVVLAAHEVHVDAVDAPEVGLVCPGAVGSRPDDMPEVRHRPYERHRDRTGRVPELQRAVDVEAHDGQSTVSEESLRDTRQRHLLQTSGPSRIAGGRRG
jgi:hypothetical protein